MASRKVPGTASPLSFENPENRHNFDLFYDFLNQSPLGLAICQAEASAKSRIVDFFREDRLKEQIFFIDMSNPVRDTIELQEAIINISEKSGNKKNIFFIYNIFEGLYQSGSDPRDFSGKLNLIRDFFMRHDAAFVFFFNEYFVKIVIQAAFDFYDWVKFTFIFQPETDELPLGLMEPFDIESYPVSKPYEKITYLEKAVKKTGKSKEKALNFLELGKIYFKVRDYDAAIKSYRDSFKILKAQNDKHGQAAALHQLGMVYEELHNLKEAEKLYKQALKTFDELGDSSSQASAYHQLGNIAFRKREFSNAEALYNRALEINGRTGNHKGETSNFLQLGMTAREMGNYQRAETLFTAALVKSIGNNNNSLVKITLELLMALMKSSTVSEAIEKLKTPAEIRALLRDIIANRKADENR